VSVTQFFTFFFFDKYIFSHFLGLAFGDSDFHQRAMVLQHDVFNVQSVPDSENQEQVCDL